MPLGIYTSRDCKGAFAEQTTYDTALADSANLIEIDCAMEDIQPDPNKVDLPSVHGSRNKLQGDVSTDFYQVLGGVSWALDVRPDIIDHLCFAFSQKVVEEATGAKKKTFTFPATQPDFTNASDGYTATIFDLDPVAAHSLKVKNAISSHLKFAIKANGYLSVLIDWVGMGNAAASTFTGTLTRVTGARYHASNRARFTLNFGGGPVALTFAEIEFDLKQTIVGIGQNGSGGYQSYGITERSGMFNVKALKDDNLLTARSNISADTAISWNLGWGNATPGSVNGDLDLACSGKLYSAKKLKEDVLWAQLAGEILPATSSASLFTLIMANNTLRGW